jgi:sugar phosphate permease
MLSLAGFFLCVVEYATMTQLVLYLTESLYFGAIAAGGLLAMTQATGAFGKPASGFISDRLFGGHRKRVFLVMIVMTGIACFVLAISGRALGWLVYPLLAMLGLMAIGWGGLYTTMAGELGSKQLAGVASGASGAIVTMGVILGPPLFGYVVDSTGSYQAAWLVMTFFAVVSVIFASLIREYDEPIHCFAPSLQT